jgi:hypothetical protein
VRCKTPGPLNLAWVDRTGGLGASTPGRASWYVRNLSRLVAFLLTADPPPVPQTHCTSVATARAHSTRAKVRPCILTAGFSHFEETEFGLALEKSEHMTVEVQDGDIIVTVAGFLCGLLQARSLNSSCGTAHTATTMSCWALAWQAANVKAREWGGSFKSEGTTHGALLIVRCP